MQPNFANLSRRYLFENKYFV